MKGILISLFFCGLVFVSLAQRKKVREADLEGLWQMQIELEENFLEEEIDEEDNVLIRTILQTTGNFVENVLGQIDIKMEFKTNRELNVYVEAFSTDKEILLSTWKISDGKLYIDDFDAVALDNNDYWMFEGDVLVLHEYGDGKDEDAYVYMYRMH